MIDTQRLGALLRALIRDDVLDARARTPPAAPVRPASVIGPELPRPDPHAAQEQVSADTGAREAARQEHPPRGVRSNAVLRAANDQRPEPSAVLRLADRLPATVDDAVATPGRAQAPDSGAAATPAARRATLTAVPGGASPSAALALSDTGRVLLSALRMPVTVPAAELPGSAMQPLLHAPASPERAAPGAAPARPLVAVPPHSEFATDRLALQLKDAVEFSGVFYESHLAQWADDMRPRALLAHEPQSRWPVAADIAQQSAMPAAPADYAAPVLRQQLEVLDTGRFLWSGELWPGQRAMLVIEEDDPGRPQPGHPADAQAPRWRMRLALQFPQLGAIDATLGIAGEAVDLSLHCDNAEVAARLRDATPALRAAVAERALDLAHVTIGDGPA